MIMTQQNVMLCINCIKVDGVLFLIAISIDTYYWTAQFIQTKTVSNSKEALVEIVQLYNKARFCIKNRTNIKIKTLQEALFDKLEINTNVVNLQEHIPEAECNNRLIKKQ